MGVFELLFDPLIPPKVAIAEAIRLSRKFNTPESASFVNALLDHLYQESLGEHGDKQKLAQIAEELLKSEKIASETAQTVQAKEQSERESPMTILDHWKGAVL